MNKATAAKLLALCLLAGAGLTACGEEPHSDVPSFSLGELEVRQDESGNGYLKDAITGTEIVAVFRYDEAGVLCAVDLEAFAEEENARPEETAGEAVSLGWGKSGYTYEEKEAHTLAPGEWLKFTADFMGISSFYSIPAVKSGG